MPSIAVLSGSYFELSKRADQIVAVAEQAGSLRVALWGLNTMRQMLDSVARLAAQDPAATAAGQAAAPGRSQPDLAQITNRLIEAFDREPDIKARVAAALVSLDEQASPGSATPVNANAARAATAAELTMAMPEPRVASQRRRPNVWLARPNHQPLRPSRRHRNNILRWPAMRPRRPRESGHDPSASPSPLRPMAYQIDPAFGSASNCN